VAEIRRLCGRLFRGGRGSGFGKAWIEAGEGGGSGGFLLKVAEHGRAEEGVGASLVALALLAKPSDDVSIEAKGELPLDGAIEGIADGIAPELFREFRDVGEVNFSVGGAVRAGSKLCQAALAGGGDRASREFLSHDFGHNVGAPFAWLCWRR